MGSDPTASFPAPLQEVMNCTASTAPWISGSSVVGTPQLVPCQEDIGFLGSVLEISPHVLFNSSPGEPSREEGAQFALLICRRGFE